MKAGRLASPVIEAVRKRGHASDAPEDYAKVALVAEPGFQTDVGDGFAGPCQQALCPAHAEVIQIGDERLAHRLLEQLHEAAGAHGAKPGSIIHTHRLVIAPLQVLQHRA